MEDMSIHFDLEAILDVLTDAEKNYLEFLKLSNSFYGWLLTLDKAEFEHVYINITHDFVNDPLGAIPFLFTQVELIPKGEGVIIVSDLERDIKRKKRMVRIIRACKEGLLRYVPGETDMEWKFELTELGLRLDSAANLTNFEEDEH